MIKLGPTVTASPTLLSYYVGVPYSVLPTGPKTGDRKFGGTPTCRSDDDEGAREVRTEKRITKQQKRGHHLELLRLSHIATHLTTLATNVRI